MTDVKRLDSVYRLIRQLEVIKSEKIARKIPKVLSQEYLNLFNANNDITRFYNLSSIYSVDSALAVKTSDEKFSSIQNRIHFSAEKIHDPDKWNLNNSRKQERQYLWKQEANCWSKEKHPYSMIPRQRIHFDSEMINPLNFIRLSLVNPNRSHKRQIHEHILL